MYRFKFYSLVGGLAAISLLTFSVVQAQSQRALIAPRETPVTVPNTPGPLENAARLVSKGREVFRHDTLGSEVFWGDALGLHKTLAGSAFGGVGAGVSPATALSVGLKIDVTALSKPLKDALAHGQVDLNDPANTQALLRADSVVGVKGFFDGDEMTSVGINCALCHSTVDDSFAPGIGNRLDGWANRDLNVGEIMNLAQDLTPFTSLLNLPEATVRDVFSSWGPGRFDAALLLDGQAFRPDGKTASVLIPSIYGLGGVNLATYTGWGSVSHWNALVGTLEMGGQGRFFDPRLDDAAKFPIAAANGFSNVDSPVDRTSPILEPLHLYQLSLTVPKPPEGSFDPVAAARGKDLFENQANCSSCHVAPLYTDPGFNAHTGAEIGIDEFQALRSPLERYRTTPLRGLFARAKGGFFHDGRFADLGEVVEHYDDFFTLGLNATEKGDLIEFLKSL